MPDAETTELSQSARWSLQQIERSTASLRAEIIHLEKALDEQTGRVQPVKTYPIDKVINGRTMESYGSPEAARKAAEAAYAESLPLREENAAIVKENNRVLCRLVQQIENAGIGSSKRVWKGGRLRGKWEWETADWKVMLSDNIHLSDAWSASEQRYKNWLHRCDEWRQKLNAQAKDAEQKKQADARKIKAEAQRLLLARKYTPLDDDADMNEVLHAILSKDKHLWLAHYLQANRNDWSEGCDFAEIGLRGYKPETEEEQAIHDAVLAKITRYPDEMDGRIFRDGEWGYGEIFPKVPADLMADYVALTEFIDQ